MSLKVAVLSRLAIRKSRKFSHSAAITPEDVDGTSDHEGGTDYPPIRFVFGHGFGYNLLLQHAPRIYSRVQAANTSWRGALRTGANGRRRSACGEPSAG